MHELFDICVDILIWIGDVTGVGYKPANIWIFVIIHPMITLFTFIAAFIYARKYYKLRNL